MYDVMNDRSYAVTVQYDADGWASQMMTMCHYVYFKKYQYCTVIVCKEECNYSLAVQALSGASGQLFNMLYSCVV